MDIFFFKFIGMTKKTISQIKGKHIKIIAVNSKVRQSSRENIKKLLYEVLLCCMEIVL